MNNGRKITLLLCFLDIYLVLAFVLYFGVPGEHSVFLPWWVVLAIFLLILINIALIILFKFKPKFYEKIKSALFEEDEEYNKYIENILNTSKLLNESKSTKKEKQLDIMALMLENTKEIRDYYI